MQSITPHSTNNKNVKMLISFLYFNAFAYHNLELVILLRNKCQEMKKVL